MELVFNNTSALRQSALSSLMIRKYIQNGFQIAKLCKKKPADFDSIVILSLAPKEYVYQNLKSSQFPQVNEDGSLNSKLTLFYDIV